MKKADIVTVAVSSENNKHGHTMSFIGLFNRKTATLCVFSRNHLPVSKEFAIFVGELCT